MFGHKKRKHNKLRAKPFPNHWRQLLTKNLSYIDRLTADDRHELEGLINNHKNLLSSYAATNPAEFFAVAIERFFECPKDLKRQSPDLYEQLKDFYKQDPAERFTRKH